MEFPSLAYRKVFVKKGEGGWNRSSTHVVCISWPGTVIFRSLPCVDRNMRLRYILFKSFSVRVTARVGGNDLIFQSRWVSFSGIYCKWNLYGLIAPYCDRNPYQWSLSTYCILHSSLFHWKLNFLFWEQCFVTYKRETSVSHLYRSRTIYCI